jgi:peptidoglycan/LPS O-acetylase OafA/YrhL
MVFYLLLAGLFSWGVHRRSGSYAAAFAIGAVALGGVLPMSALGHWSIGPGAGPLVLNAVTDLLILAGLVFALSSRSWPVKCGTSLAALVALVLLTFNQSYPYPWEGCTILALMFAGTLLYRAEQGQVRPVPSAALVVAVLVLVTAAGVWHGARHGHHWQVQWATSVLLAGATFGIGLAVRHWRVPRWCAWLGVISYSVYLLHPLVFNAYRSVPVLHRPHGMPGQVLLFAGLLAVIIGLSALTYYLIEKPMQRLGHRVAARFPNTTGTPSGDGSSDLGDGAAAAASRSASSSTAVAGGSGGSP